MHQMSYIPLKNLAIEEWELTSYTKLQLLHTFEGGEGQAGVQQTWPAVYHHCIPQYPVYIPSP